MAGASMPQQTRNRLLLVAAAQAVPVKADTARRGDLDLSLKVIGSAQAWSTVTVQARVNGQLQSLSFKPGGHVGKGETIIRIDFALEHQRVEGMAPAQAIVEACRVRFRPIMMTTTMAAFAGTLPIALGIGAGASSRRPLGLAVVGGLLVSQVLTLYLTPVIYLYMDRLQQRFGHRSARPGAAIAEGDA
ncbi:MAG TPA: efflux RND transporter permease subunit [Acetobacteraceae bacterium]